MVLIPVVVGETEATKDESEYEERLRYLRVTALEQAAREVVESPPLILKLCLAMILL